MSARQRNGLLSIFRKNRMAPTIGVKNGDAAVGVPVLWEPPQTAATSRREMVRQNVPDPPASVSGSWIPPVVETPPRPVSDQVPVPASGLWRPPAPAGTVAAEAERPRLVFAVDATGSREHAWRAARKLTDAVLKALPGELDVAFAVHGGGRVHTFTRFTSKPGRLRDMAAGVSCKAGGTRLLDILERVLKLKRVGVVLYIGDSFEESDAQACRLADALLKQETRVIILHDGPPPVAFGEIAERSGGALLPFEASALDQLGELLGAVAALAVGGVAAVEEQQATMPAAAVLLEKLDPKRLMIAHKQ